MPALCRDCLHRAEAAFARCPACGSRRAAGPAAGVQTKRGCPFSCIYCTYPLVEGAAVRVRAASDVADEFQDLHDRFGAKTAYIVDSQFNYPADHAGSVCEELVSRRDRCKIRWSCMANPGFMEDDLALFMRAARCEMVDLSVESGCDSMLENLGKNFSTDDVRRAFKALERAGLPFDAWILLGGPGETRQTVCETLDFLESAGAANVIFSVGIRICPGTGIERVARAEGVLPFRLPEVTRADRA